MRSSALTLLASTAAEMLTWPPWMTMSLAALTCTPCRLTDAPPCSSTPPWLLVMVLTEAVSLAMSIPFPCALFCMKIVTFT